MSQIHYFCPLCLTPNVLKNYSSLFKHIRQEHRGDSSFNIRCELSVFCGNRYSIFDSYRRHIYRYHRSLIDSFDNNHGSISSNINDIIDDIEDFSLHPTFNNQSDFIDDPDLLIYPDEEVSEMDHEFFNFDPISVPIVDDN
jgi:hypothetical protein